MQLTDVGKTLSHLGNEIRNKEGSRQPWPRKTVLSPEGAAHPGRRFSLDDVFLLLCLGLAVSMVLYVFWGLWELVQVPPFR